MKLKLNYTLIAIITCIVISSCEKSNYPGGVISPYIGIYDVRTLFKDTPVDLNIESLEGSSKITGMVVSDHSGGNLPDGLLIVQDRRRLNFLRGIAISLGSDAASYSPGDSVTIDITGGTLDRVNGILTIQNLTSSKIERISSDNPISISRVNIDDILNNPSNYESTLFAIVKGGFAYTPEPGQVLSGDQKINDGFGELTLRTNPNGQLASLPQYRMANYYGILFTEQVGESLVPYHCLRTEEDLVELTSVYTTPKIIITGWMADPQGTDSNHEYMQFMATEDIDFSATPFSVVTTNNANASTPTGVPTNGWATGGLRTYKFNLSSGFAPKGTFFYVGGTNRLINASGSTSIAHANWITTRGYNSTTGNDFGSTTTNLLANSGNAYGIAVFEGTTVGRDSIPQDVMFVATGGSLYSNGVGYRIANTDYYDIIDPITLTEQPFYRAGGNTKALVYTTPTDQGFFYQLGGVFNLTLGRWTTARTQNNPQITNESTLEEIENELSTKLID